jgi:hypothetical protein
MNRVIASALALCCSAAACTSTEPLRGPFDGSAYVLVLWHGQSPPARLNQDTMPGAAIYVLLADTLRFDAHESIITGTTVEKIEYVGSTSPPIPWVFPYKIDYSRSGDAGTGTPECIPPGAPCAPLPMAFFRVGDSLFVQFGTGTAFNTYLRIR